MSGLQQFEVYAFATGIHVASEETRVRTLLYCIGPRAQVILSLLMSDEEADKPYVEVTRRFTSSFVHPLNKVYEIYRFHKQTKEAGETVVAARVDKLQTQTVLRTAAIGVKPGTTYSRGGGTWCLSVGGPSA